MFVPFYSTVFLAFESGNVIGLRMMKMMSGGSGSHDEAHLMVMGKMHAMFEASASLISARNEGRRCSQAIKSAGLPRWSQALVTIENFRAARMGKDKQKKTANVAQDGAVYDDDRFVRCQRCGSWINARNPSSLFEYRGPVPHPRIAGAEWIDDDD